MAELCCCRLPPGRGRLLHFYPTPLQLHHTGIARTATRTLVLTSIVASSPQQQQRSSGSSYAKKQRLNARNTPTVFKEDIYNIDQGLQLSTEEIIEMANNNTLNQGLQGKKKVRESLVEAQKTVPRRTHKILKVIAGKASGKKLLSVADVTVRPMMEVVRGAVFDILQARTQGFKSLSSGRWLDLYSGTGSVGIEALSRGCTAAHFVEMDPWIATEVLKPNLNTIDMSQHSVIHVMKVESFFHQTSLPGCNLGTFDYVSVTPPYEAVDYEILLNQLATSSLLQKDTFVVVEYPSKVCILDMCGSLQKVLSRRYGRTHLAIYGPDWALRD